MPPLRGRNSERSGRDRKAESDEEFDLGSGEEAEEGYGGRTQRNEPEPTEQWGGKAKKGRKANTRTWADMVKGLKEEELETSNLDKSMNVSETTDSVKKFDSEEPNHLKAKRTKGQRKGRQHHDNKVAGKGRTSNQADRKVEACGIERVEECEQGRVGCELKKNHKLSFRGSVEIQAQHWLDLLHKLRTGSVWTGRFGPNRLRKPGAGSV